MKEENTSLMEVEPLDNIKQEERISIISGELVSMKPKKQIIDEYCKKWKCQPSTIRAIMKEAIIYLSSAAYQASREQMRALNSERLEQLFGKAKNLNDKIKIINLLNKTYGVYEQNINLGNKSEEEFKLDLGV